MPGRRRTLALLAFVLGSLLLLPSGAAAQTGSVLRARIDGPITPVIADHVADAVAAAADGGHSALLLEMDTPGGLDSSMRSIVKDLLGSPVPVIVYVAPAGARAASAGAIITFAAHVAAMAPGTNIGAATPIDLEGGEVLDKVVNDAVAYVTAIAEERGRDVDFAVDTVRDGRSASATEALEVGAVDLVAPDRATLLDELDGRTVVLADGTERTLATAQAPVTEFQMTGVRSLLQRLADPNLAFLFISIGSLAVIYELANPGVGLGGVIGAILLVLAFFSLAVLPVDVAGVVLLVLAIALFVGELFVPGVGVFAGGGTLALIAAGVLLFQRPTGIGVDLSFLLPVPLLVGAAAVVVGRLAYKTRHAPAYTGASGTMVGAHGTVRTADEGTAQVLVEGALWRARRPEGPLAVGDRVRVIAMHGLDLVVEPDAER
jgi:membrane-bound serine protease (ClpP class)